MNKNRKDTIAAVEFSGKFKLNFTKNTKKHNANEYCSKSGKQKNFSTKNKKTIKISKTLNKICKTFFVLTKIR